MTRLRWIIAAAVSVAFIANAPARAADAAFDKWLAAQWPPAQALGVSRATFDAATHGLEPDLSLPDLVIPGRPDVQPAQAEFVQTPADYVKEASIARLSEQGRKLAAQHRDVLTRIEREFGVPGNVVLAIWGRETAFGSHKLAHDAIRVLATQAWLGRRKEKFAEEFLKALQMLQEGHVTRANMRSSWAGAMGLTQFLPSEFYNYAVDFDGDGRRDIWTSVPDALASAAKQLADKGWQRGRGWAYEVRAPKSVDCTIAQPGVTMTVAKWLERGYVLAHGRKPGRDELGDEASLLLPEGTYGPAFLTLKNYYVIKEYNFSDLYVLFVGHLSDRITDPRPFETRWSMGAQLKSAEVERMQKRLTELGIYRDKIDGRAGMLTRAALGAYQKANGLKVDCWPTAAVLQHMRR